MVSTSKIIVLTSLLLVLIGTGNMKERIEPAQTSVLKHNKKSFHSVIDSQNAFSFIPLVRNRKKVPNPACGPRAPQTDITGKYILQEGFSIFEDEPENIRPFYKSVLKIEKLKKGEFIYSHAKKVRKYAPVHDVLLMKCLGNKWVMMNMSYNDEMEHYELDIINYSIYKFIGDHLFYIRFSSNNTSYFIFKKVNTQKQLHLSLRKTFKEANKKLNEEKKIYYEARSIEQDEANDIDVYYDCKDGEYMTTYDYEEADYVTRTVKRRSRFKRYDSLFIAKSKKYAPHLNPDWLNTVDSCL